MRADALAKVVERARCRVFGHEDAGNDAQREVLAALIRGFDHPDATVLCEPSLARKTTRPPDAVLVDPVAGVHVVEVKGVTPGPDRGDRAGRAAQDPLRQGSCTSRRTRSPRPATPCSTSGMRRPAPATAN